MRTLLPALQTGEWSPRQNDKLVSREASQTCGRVCRVSPLFSPRLIADFGFTLTMIRCGLGWRLSGNGMRLSRSSATTTSTDFQVRRNEAVKCSYFIRFKGNERITNSVLFNTEHRYCSGSESPVHQLASCTAQGLRFTASIGIRERIQQMLKEERDYGGRARFTDMLSKKIDRLLNESLRSRSGRWSTVVLKFWNAATVQLGSCCVRRYRLYKVLKIQRRNVLEEPASTVAVVQLSLIYDVRLYSVVEKCILTSRRTLYHIFPYRSSTSRIKLNKKLE